MAAMLRLLALIVVAAVAVHAFEGLYGTLEDSKTGLARVDPLTGAVTPIGPQYPGLEQARGVAAIDYLHGDFYFLAYNWTCSTTMLLGLSLATGAIVSDHGLPFDPTHGGGGQALSFNPLDAAFIATGRLYPTDDHFIYSVKDGVLNLRCQFNRGDADGTQAAYDWNHGVEWVVAQGSAKGSVSMYGCNITTKAVEEVPFDADAGHYLSTMHYDLKTNSLVGMGYRKFGSAEFNRTIARYEVDKKQWTIVGYLPIDRAAYLLDGMQALDYKTRTLYVVWVNVRLAAFELLGISIDTAQVKTRVQLQQKLKSIAYANDPRAADPAVLASQ